MASSYIPFQVHCFLFQKRSISPNFHLFKTAHLSSSFKGKPFLRELQQLAFAVDVSKVDSNNTCIKLLDAFLDSAFKFELREAALVTNIQGKIPSDFPEGVYKRNGANPVFGGLKSAEPLFGSSSPVWVEGEGMLHALYFSKGINGSWATVIYNNSHVESETFKLENQRNKPFFLPAVEGDSLSVLSAHLLNLVAHLSNIVGISWSKILFMTQMIWRMRRFYSMTCEEDMKKPNVTETVGRDEDTETGEIFRLLPDRVVLFGMGGVGKNMAF